MDRQESDRSESAGPYCRPLELPAGAEHANDFPAAADFLRAVNARLESIVEQEIKLAYEFGTAVTVPADISATAIPSFDLETLDRLQKEIAEREANQPFQLCEHIPDEFDGLLKVGGKVRMGRRRWREFNSFSWPGLDERGAEEWLRQQKIYDLDKLGEDMRREDAEKFWGWVGGAASKPIQ